MDCTKTEVRMLSKLLDEALDLAPTARQGWLERLATRDARAADELRSLLARLAPGSSGRLLQAPPAHADAYLPGHRIGPFRLRHGLGIGGTSEVWCAEHLGARNAEWIALKLPRGDRAGACASLRREARVLRRLQHPGIVPLLDSGEHGELPWLAMPVLRGEPLDAWGARQGRRARLAVVAQLAQTLAWLHSRGIVHRDLKPANVLVDAHGRAQLIDFGIAAFIGTPGEDALRAQTHSYTLGYAAPEQVAGAAPAPTVDLYGLGLLLCEASLDPAQVRLAHREWHAQTDQPVANLLAQRLLAQMPSGAHRRLAEAALRPDAHRRLTSAEDFARGIAVNS